MAKDNIKDTGEDKIVNVESALSRTEQFIEDNKKIISIVVGAIIVVVGGFILYKRFYLKPLQEEAQSQMFVAEQYFEKDSFRLALKGDGNNLGFHDIINEYGSTKSGNLAKYYAGICYLKTKDFNKAIEYLEDFKSSDKFLAPISLGSIGDANMELGKTKEALDYYLKAADKILNDFTTPVYLMKAGMVYEKLGDTDNALKIYERVEKEYSKTQEGKKAEKYIAKLKYKSGK
ncbi:MAG: tetratricopeptide repeat protein [Bacteroidia bacterium]|nr:tetratricopeptide repeat protein [Bacteroidia bacterium]